MAIYYALVKDGHIQCDTATGQLEIYECSLDAKRAKPHGFTGCEVVKIEVKREENTNG